jgi:hypothetical protein
MDSVGSELGSLEGNTPYNKAPHFRASAAKSTSAGRRP